MSKESARPFMSDEQFDRWSSEQRRQHEADEMRRSDERRSDDHHRMVENIEAERRHQQLIAPRTFAEAMYNFWRGLIAFLWLIVICVLSVAAQIVDLVWIKTTDVLGHIWLIRSLSKDVRESVAGWILLLSFLALVYVVAREIKNWKRRRRKRGTIV